MHSRPAMRTVLLAVTCLVSALPFLACRAQQSQVGTARISLISTDPSRICSLSRAGTLDFGNLVLPSSGIEKVTIDPVTGDRSTNLTATEVFGVALVQIRGFTSAATYQVDVSFPTTLDHSSGTGSLTFTGAWAQSATLHGSYTSISGSTVTVPSPTFFRVGGEISGIDSNTASGDYTGTITFLGYCV